MAVIKSGATTDQWTIDPNSKAGRVSLYDENGNPVTTAQDGTDNSGVSQPSGGTGIRGWLSAIYKALTGTIPVTGDFYQATQPVSGSVSVSNLPSTQPVSGIVSVSNFPPTQPVSGVVSVSNLPATQPVSGSVSVSNFPASQPVTGTFFQATQPISGAVSISGTVSTTEVGVPSGLVGDVQTKGVQGVNAQVTQDFKDSGRTYVVLYADRIAGVTTEALITMTINRGGSITTGTTYTVTAGKTLRIQSINSEIQNTTTVVNRVLTRVRSGTSVTVASPIVGMSMAASSAALATSGNTDPHSFPDGLEISGGQQIGISQLCNVTTAGIVSITVIGYEY